MKNYLELAPKYLSAHARKTRLTVLSVVISVALVVGIFSMLDALVKFERAQVLKDEGNYHILVRRPSEKEINAIVSRIDVKNSGSLKDMGEGTINGQKCVFGALDEAFAGNLNFKLADGSYPASENEIMLEKWFMAQASPALAIGDRVSLSIANGAPAEYVISGNYQNWGATQAAGIPIVFLSMQKANTLTPVSHDLFILFKDGVQVIRAEDEIKKSLNISEDRIGRNEGLLALMLQTRNSNAFKIYLVGAMLSFLVLVTAVVMIYNTFNISVVERVRQFGLLRCVGASQKQIVRLVQREGISVFLRAAPLGVLAGILMTFLCSAVLKFYNPQLFGDIPLFNLSLAGIGAGVVVGFLTVYVATLLPARKASRVSPVSALLGGNEAKVSARRKQGFLMKVLPSEIAIGAGNALNKKWTLFLMSSSIALSIIIFLGFNVLVNPTTLGVRPTRAYTPDISLTSEEGMQGDVYHRLVEITGVKTVSRRMSAYVDASFDANRLTDYYQKEVGGVANGANGRMVAPEKSWLVSYDATGFEWAKEYLSKGLADEETLNASRGLIAVQKVNRNGLLNDTAVLQLGDKVYFETPAGTREFTVLGTVNASPYWNEENILSMFITTEKQFTEITGSTVFKTIDVQLKANNREQTVGEIKKAAGTAVKVLDKRQYNQEANNTYMTVAVFVYGFVGVIALISILNIINTMNTSVASKTKYFGIMRAVGLSGEQLSRLVLAEAAVYSLGGCLAGCVLGVMMQKGLAGFMMADWKFPLVQVIIICLVCLLTAGLSTIGPLKRIKASGITEVIGSL